VVSQAWKGHERYVAKALTGHRIPRGADFSDRLPDVIAPAANTLARAHGAIFAECKYSQSNPWVSYIEEQYDGKLLKAGEGEDTIVLFELEDIRLLSDPTRWSRATQVDRKVPQYMYDHIEQSKGYIEICKSDIVLTAVLRKMTGLSRMDAELPIVVMAQRYKSFRLAYVNLNDLMSFYISQDDPSYRTL
tara:strand:- start:175354 stop:175923 length:570 start_codon:yes stop_codon:yes gene_type:complete